MTVKSELINPQVSFISGNAGRPSVYLQISVERMPSMCETGIAAQGGHFDESKV